MKNFQTMMRNCGKKLKGSINKKPPNLVEIEEKIWKMELNLLAFGDTLKKS